MLAPVGSPQGVELCRPVGTAVPGGCDCQVWVQPEILRSSESAALTQTLLRGHSSSETLGACLLVS